MRKYALAGSQIEMEAKAWGLSQHLKLKIPTIEDIFAVTDDSSDPKNYLPPYPSDPDVVGDEIQELLELAQLSDDPSAIVSVQPGRERLRISRFLQLRPQPLGSVFNTLSGSRYAVIQTGRELARWFEAETPGLAHRHALNYLLPQTGWSPPRQARIWAALDIAVYAAMLAAWHYKWNSQRANMSYRPRPVEVDERVRALYNFRVNATGSGDDTLKLAPQPSPGTPRHPSYPAGHSSVGAAASEVLSYFFPDLRPDFDELADNSGMARLWAGIHYRSDHLGGIKLGRAVARLVLNQLRSEQADRATAEIDKPSSFRDLTDVKALTVNRDVYVGRVSLQEAKAHAFRQFSQQEATQLLEPFDKMIKTEYGGEITDFQFRYHLGRRAFVIRGQRTGRTINAYAYQDGEFDFSEWVNIPSALTGPFVALPQSKVNSMSDEHQKHFEALFGRNVMLEDMQLEFTGSRYVIVGVMRWKPPNTHLHAVVVIKLAN